ncbi:beta strand repeat-containing protein [Companilactobacillus kimchii]|uniref:beta strand repeat-containing protein n=1 Tax=Companilactobacillus kimchii TaxID=2801452 RepID=UPI0034E2D315
MDTEGNLSINGGTIAESTGKPDTTLWGGHASDVTTIDFTAPTTAPKDASYIFSNMNNLTTIKNLSNLNTSETTNAEGLFKNDSKLTDVDWSGNDLSSMTNISHMYENDTNLQSTEYSSVSDKNVKNVSDASYTYANCTNLTTPNIGAWQGSSMRHTDGMFKNDSKLQTLDLSKVIFTQYINTGDSSKGEGMFDGTNLSSIILYNNDYFSKETALTSSSGNIWENSDNSFSFNGIPTFDANNNATGGIGSLFDGTQKVHYPSSLIYKTTFTASGVASKGTTVKNLVTIHTNLGDKQFIAEGIVGETSSVDIPSTFEVDGQTYTTTTKTVNATFGQTTATTNADEIINYYGAPIAGSTISVATSLGDKDVNVPAGNVGNTSNDVALPNVEGYNTPKIKVSYTSTGAVITDEDGNNITSNNPIQYTGKPVDKSQISVATSQGTQTVDVPAGIIGTTSDNVKLTDVNGYNTPKIKISYTPSGIVITDIDGKKITPDNPIQYTGKPVDKSQVSVATSQGTQTIDIPAGIIGTISDNVKLTDVDGYNTPKIKVSYTPSGIVITDADGKEINSNNPIQYTGKSVNRSQVSVATSQGTQTVDVPAGIIGTTSDNVKLTDVDGYNTPKIKASYTPSGVVITDTDGKKITPDNPIQYIGKPVNESKVSVATSQGIQTVDVPAGTIGTTSDKVKLTDVNGYNTPKIKVSYTPSGVVITDIDGKEINSNNPIQYIGKPVNESKVSVATSQGTQTIDIPAGTIGTTSNPIDLPTVDGYTAPQVKVNYTPQGNVVTDLDGNPITAKNPIKYFGNHVDSSTFSVTTPDGSKSVDIPAGTIGTTSNPIDLPTVDGYTAPQVKVNYTPQGNVVTDLDGNPINSNNPIKYVGTPNPAQKVTVTNLDGSTTTLNIPAGHYGDPETKVSATEQAGYQTPSVTVDYGKDGTPILKDQNGNVITDSSKPLTYTGNPVASSQTSVITSKGSQDITIPAGTVGTTQLVDLNPIDGYKTPQVKVTYKTDGTASITDVNGNSITNENPIKYVGTPNPAQKVNITNPDGSTTTLNIPAGNFGDKDITVAAPKEDGYTSPSVTITYGKNGTPVLKDGNGKVITDTNQPLEYTGNHVDSSTFPVTTPEGEKSVTIPAGTVGTTSDPITLPTVNGYTDPQVKVNYTPQGNVVTDLNGNPITSENPIKYVGTPNPAQKVNVTNPDGSTTTLDIPAGNFGDKDVTVTAPNKDGYQAPSVIVTYGPNGTPTLKDSKGKDIPSTGISYNGDPVPESKVNINTSKGSQEITVPAGTVGTTSNKISLNPINGYETPEVEVTYTSKGIVVKQNDKEISKDNPVQYLGVENPAQQLNVKNPDGSVSTVTVPAGRFGDAQRTINVPEKSGYKAPNLAVKYNADGKSTIIDINNDNKSVDLSTPIIYTPINSGNVNQETDVEDIKATLATFADKPAVDIYNFDNIQMSIAANRKLGTDTGWLTDQKLSFHGETYYRVATDEWVKASQVYLYKADLLNLKAHTDSDKELIRAEGNSLNHNLDKGTQFTSDRIAYINGQEYYRVSANEFIKVSDADVINGNPDSSAVKLVVATYSDQPAVQLYSFNGNQPNVISNQRLAPKTDWLVDQKTTVDGEIYYRVATDKWVKASQVYVFEYAKTVATVTGDAAKPLYTAEGNLSNRKLATNTSWKADRTIQLNGQTFYRLATNEFINAKDISIN